MRGVVTRQRAKVAREADGSWDPPTASRATAGQQPSGALVFGAVASSMGCSNHLGSKL